MRSSTWGFGEKDELDGEGSQEAEFLALLNNIQRYHFTSRGELIFDLKLDGGIAVFR